MLPISLSGYLPNGFESGVSKTSCYSNPEPALISLAFAVWRNGWSLSSLAAYHLVGRVSIPVSGVMSSDRSFWVRVKAVAVPTLETIGILLGVNTLLIGRSHLMGQPPPSLFLSMAEAGVGVGIAATLGLMKNLITNGGLKNGTR